MRKHFAAIGIAGVLFLLSMLPARSMDSAAQRTLFAALNRERKEQGLPVLKWNEALAACQHLGIGSALGERSNGFVERPRRNVLERCRLHGRSSGAYDFYGPSAPQIHSCGRGWPVASMKSN